MKNVIKTILSITRDRSQITESTNLGGGAETS